MIDDFRPLKKRVKLTLPTDDSDTSSLSDVGTSEPDFKTPEEVAAEDQPQTEPLATEVETAEKSEKKPSKIKRLHPKNWVGWPPSKKVILIAAGILVMLIGASVTGWSLTHNTITSSVHETAHHTVKKKAAPVPTTVPSTLTGLPVDPSVNQRPVTAVMIENSPDARPQSGLDQAGVVFEAMAEGGVTRFMALYQDTQPDYIGPVRSARPYYIQWALGFDAPYAHVGGSTDGLADIKTWNVRDLDEFANAGAYERISSRYAPHNVYTSIAQLNTLETKKGYTSSTYTGFVRKADNPTKPPYVTSIDMTFSGYYYNTHYDYDATTNSYKRSEQGAPHMELSKSGAQTQITPKVVIAMVVPESQGALDSSGAYYSNYNPIGSGTAYVFQDGTFVTGTWSKSGNTAPLTFTGPDNKPLKLNAGQTWIGAITATNKVTYK